MKRIKKFKSFNEGVSKGFKDDHLRLISGLVPEFTTYNWFILYHF